MEFQKTDITGLLIIKPVVFEDERGHFFESYRKELFEKNDIPYEFIQDNQSLSNKNVLRGLHYQKPPFQQGKLIRVVKGSVLDVALDIRKKSSTYGKYNSIILSEKNKLMYWIPPGFAHGFLTLEDNTILQYKCTAPYNKESEGSLLWNDPVLNIEWTLKSPVLSDKDKIAPLFAEFVSMF
jgi:dTDP-4-dehydrorhamnose 3,5-epimerase